jgi:3-phenylpropionate/trans-cinnamate dioxygenase ferredoxin subunit
MGKSVAVGKADEIVEGAMNEVTVDGQRLLVAWTGGKYYAVQNTCPHMGSLLSQGRLEGTVVTCPRHGSQFDLRDGSVVRWLGPSGLVSRLGRMLKSPRPLKTYKVRVENGKLMVEM